MRLAAVLTLAALPTLAQTPTTIHVAAGVSRISGIDAPAGSTVTVSIGAGAARPVELRALCGNGDVNGDGKVDVLDVVLLEALIVGNASQPQQGAWAYSDTKTPVCLTAGSTATVRILAAPPSTQTWTTLINCPAPVKTTGN